MLSGMFNQMFGGAGDVGTTPGDMGIGYSPDVPMSTGVDTGMNTPSQPTNPNQVSPSFWQQLIQFLGMDGGTNSSAGSGNEVGPDGKPTDKKAEIAKLGKFLTAAQGMQSTFQDSKLAQQMMQQHQATKMGGEKGAGHYTRPMDMATRILQQQGLL